MKMRYFFIAIALMFLILPSLEAQTKKRLAILPFSGGVAQDGETISILLSNQRALLDTFTVQPRNSAIDRIMGEQRYQRQSGLINSDAISEIGKLNTADLVVSGYIAKLSNTNLILISIIDVTEIQQIAGVYQTYRSIEEIRGLLPGLSQRLAEASRKNYQNLPGLAVPSFSVPSNVNTTDAMVLAQILATEIVNSGKYAVFPRTSSVEDVLREARFQRENTSGAKALGTSRSIDFILSSNVMSLGRMNLFASQILNIEGGNAIVGADREYQDMSDGVSKNLMREIASALTGVRISGPSTSSTSSSSTSSSSTSSSSYSNERDDIDEWMNRRAYIGGWGGYGTWYDGLNYGFVLGFKAEICAAQHFSIDIDIGLEIGETGWGFITPCGTVFAHIPFRFQSGFDIGLLGGIFGGDPYYFGFGIGASLGFKLGNGILFLDGYYLIGLFGDSKDDDYYYDSYYGAYYGSYSESYPNNGFVIKLGYKVGIGRR